MLNMDPEVIRTLWTQDQNAHYGPEIIMPIMAQNQNTHCES